MNCKRKRLVEKAFKQMDKTGDGVVMADDLTGVYNVKENPKVKSGEWTEAQAYRKFLDAFETSQDKDGKVSWTSTIF